MNGFYQKKKIMKNQFLSFASMLNFVNILYLREHKDNEDVVENFSFCVAALGEYGE